MILLGFVLGVIATLAGLWALGGIEFEVSREGIKVERDED